MEAPDPKSDPGPEPERLKIEGDWEDAMKRAMEKPKPAEGWPDPDPNEKQPENDDDPHE